MGLLFFTIMLYLSIFMSMYDKFVIPCLFGRIITFGLMQYLSVLHEQKGEHSLKIGNGMCSHFDPLFQTACQ